MVTAQNAAEPKSSLRRTLDRTTAMLLTAAMIIGTGLFAALGETAEKAGSGLLLAILLSGLVALATGLSAASCGINYPDEGGGFTWSRKFGYPTLGFVAGCAYLGKGIVSTVVIALAFAAYTAQMAEGLPPYLIHVIASAAVRLVTAVNLLGVELNAKMLIGTLIVQLVLLGVFLGFAIPEVQVAHLAPVLGPGVLDVLAGAAIFFWSWDGFMRMAIMASEVKEPRRTIPFAVVGGIVVAAVVFLAVAAVALGGQIRKAHCVDRNRWREGFSVWSRCRRLRSSCVHLCVTLRRSAAGARSRLLHASDRPPSRLGAPQSLPDRQHARAPATEPRAPQ